MPLVLTIAVVAATGARKGMLESTAIHVIWHLLTTWFSHVLMVFSTVAARLKMELVMFWLFRWRRTVP